MPTDRTDQLLVERIREGDPDAWRDCIARYEGRLIAFVDSRIRDRAAAEDIVQETFLGFLNALSNYNTATPLDAFLFAIAAHKLTDLLRRQGRRPAFRAGDSTTEETPEFAGRDRVASSLARSQERRVIEEEFVAGVLGPLIAEWRARGQFERLKCAELLLVKGLPNKDVARVLGITEQDVANQKHALLSKLKTAAEKSRLRSLDLSDLGGA
ncbi:MAG: sigma-70 family RNA polymerase sigma factor [Planctomyces sp.]|nr:sigma-70 family RNA polymerase sigma factor [Planctomyces sp.]